MSEIKIITNKNLPKNKIVIGEIKEMTLRDAPIPTRVKEIKTSRSGDLVKYNVSYDVKIGNVVVDYDLILQALEKLNDRACCSHCGNFHNLKELQMYQLRMKSEDPVRFQRCKKCKKDWELSDERFTEICHASNK